ncbi:MAG: topoisomerase IV subunit A [Rhodospirillaceae bacterium]|nr:MAG: topoisomerase IV subunit A [Rhodospirillaceae bacterium]
MTEIIDIRLDEALSERYLTYALSTIVARSLPDVRDGLKPVHRRLLFAMRALRLDPDMAFKKCARIVGDVIGKFHPHGDAAVYETLVRLAQDFAVRYPLVEGQGNFGNIDGDNPAAMRYTEARLSAVSQALMEGLDENAVDFRPTYDSTEEEPLVMPAAFPNLLANGATGIAVGMATNIPPHNVGEVCEALLYLIRKPVCEVTELMRLVRGPDFPTGGVLAESAETLLQAYRTGRGSLRLRARWAVEKLPHGLYQVVITEIPYQVQKARVIERIADLLAERAAERKVALLADVRDESTEKVRIVLEPRSRTVEPGALMEQLFRATDLEIRFGLNMNVLDADGIPRVMGLKQVLQGFLEHRYRVLERRTCHRLEKIARRLEMLEGSLKAYLNLNAVIHIIREEDEPKPVLMETLSLTDGQAEAILNMRLRSLRRLEEKEIHAEHVALSAEKEGLEKVLADSSLCWHRIGDEIREIRRKFGPNTKLGRRRTEIGAAVVEGERADEAVVDRECLTVILSEKGWLRAVKGHGETDSKFKEGDSLRFSVPCTTADRLLLFASNGRFYTLNADRIPRGRGFGEPLPVAAGVAYRIWVYRRGKRGPGANPQWQADHGGEHGRGGALLYPGHGRCRGPDEREPPSSGAPDRGCAGDETGPGELFAKTPRRRLGGGESFHPGGGRRGRA